MQREAELLFRKYLLIFPVSSSKLPLKFTWLNYILFCFLPCIDGSKNCNIWSLALCRAVWGRIASWEANLKKLILKFPLLAGGQTDRQSSTLLIIGTILQVASQSLMKKSNKNESTALFTGEKKTKNETLLYLTGLQNTNTAWQHTMSKGCDGVSAFVPLRFFFFSFFPLNNFSSSFCSRSLTGFYSVQPCGVSGRLWSTWKVAFRSPRTPGIHPSFHNQWTNHQYLQFF